jgi:hypothetical protein
MSKRFTITIQDPSGKLPYITNINSPDVRSTSGQVYVAFPRLCQLEMETDREARKRSFFWQDGALTIRWDGTDRIYHPAWCHIQIREDELEEVPDHPLRDRPFVDASQPKEPVERSTGNTESDPPIFIVREIPNRTSAYRARVLTARPGVTDSDFRVVIQLVADEAEANIYLVHTGDTWLVQCDDGRENDVRQAYKRHAEALRDPEHGPARRA